jgi:hypothetical protein
MTQIFRLQALRAPCLPRLSPSATLALIIPAPLSKQSESFLQNPFTQSGITTGSDVSQVREPFSVTLLATVCLIVGNV